MKGELMKFRFVALMFLYLWVTSGFKTEAHPLILGSSPLRAENGAAEADSTRNLKNRAASEIRNFENLSGALKVLSKLLDDKLKRASQALSEVFKTNPNDIDALFLRGILERLDGKLSEAEVTLRKVVSMDDRFSAFDFPNVWLQLGVTYREKNEFEKAVDAFKQGALINLNDTWPLVQLSLVFIEMNRPEEASEAFYAGLTQISDSSNIQRLFFDCKDIGTKQEIARWDGVRGLSDKSDFIKTFWKKRDPNPIDMVNQRFIEHYKRLEYARQHYSKAAAPWYDDRGLLYVRLGKPDRIYYGRPKDNIKENESWFYDNIKSGLFFDFVEAGSYFEVRPLLDAVERNATMDEIFQMFDERSMYNPYYQRMAEKVRNQADVDRLRAEEKLSNLSGAAGLPGSILAEQFERSKLASDFLGRSDYRQDNSDLMSYAAKQNFIFSVGAPHLPINCNFASFRVSKSVSRLEFYYVVPFSQLNFIPSISQNNLFSTAIRFNMKIYDLKYNELKYVDTVYNIAASGTEIGSHFFLDQIEQDLEPGKYVVALELRNNEKDRVGIYQFVVVVHSYSADTLSVSDIEVAQYVDNTLAKERFVKPKTNLKVVPNPAAGILKTKPLTVYYEIYNLALNKDGKSSYQISYSIKMLETSKSFFSSVAGIFGGKKEASTSSVTVKEGRSATEREYIGFDISELPAGTASLQIKVKDLILDKESTSTINLTLEEETKDDTKSETVKK